jgi:uncharacterized membrane protein (Fun14 family)
MSAPESTSGPPQRKPLWKCKSLAVALLISALGVFFWIGETPPPSAAPSASTGSVEGSSFAGARAPSTNPAPAPASGVDAVREKLKTAPLTFRYGMSYVGGFLVGYAFRRSLKTALWLAGVFTAGVLLLKWSGAYDADLGAVQHQIQEGLGYFTREAAAWKQRLSGFMPSAGVGAVGVFLGARSGR